MLGTRFAIGILLEEKIQTLKLVKQMMANIIRTTNHPVVKHYMDIIQSACEEAGWKSPDFPKVFSMINKQDYVVTDSPLIAIQYMLKGFSKHMVWFQGISPEESYMARNSRLRYAVLSWIEKTVLKKAKVVFFVSKAMETYYEKKYGLQLSQKSCIMPCFNETGIEQTAFSEEKYQKNTFTYVGGIQTWQCFEETARLYSEIEKRANTPVMFCVYTFQKEEALKILQKFGVKNYTVDCVPQAELSERIKGIKYGFIIREDCAVNNVATPTKFSNYLANGIIPIYSGALKSFAEFDKEKQIGIVYNLNEPNEGIARILEHMEKEISADEMREKCEYAFATYYNSTDYSKKIASKLKEIIKV